MKTIKRLSAGLTCMLILCFQLTPLFVMAKDISHYETTFEYTLSDEKMVEVRIETDGIEVTNTESSGGTNIIYGDVDSIVDVRIWGEAVTKYPEHSGFLMATIEYYNKDEELISTYDVDRSTENSEMVSFPSNSQIKINFGEMEASAEVRQILVYLKDSYGYTGFLLNVKESSLPTDSPVQTENSDANIDPGEDDGTVIWNDIVEEIKPIPGVDDISDLDTAEKVAVSLGGALVAGAVTLGGRKRKKNGGEDDEEKKQKTYKMKIYKNFGDGIHRGSKPVPVWARIVEVVDGHEKNRPDLSERITASGEGLTVFLAGVQNTYQTAMISVPSDSALEKAVLVFTFSGEGGVFRNRISFRVLGEPRIVFPRMTEDGTGWVVNAELDTVRMVAGMGGRDRLRFVIADAGEEPQNINFSEPEGFQVQCVKDAELAFTYWAEITNQTTPMQKENGIFAEPEKHDIPIRATFTDGSVVENALRVELWPDGISIPAKDAKNGALQVDTRPDELAGEGYSEIKPAGFEVYVCYTDTDGTAVILENPTLTFGKPDDGGKYGLTIRENFLYDISRPGSAGFLIFPKVTLPLLGEPYEAVIPVSYNGNNIQPANLPLRLLGEMPEDNPGKAERVLEVNRLKKDIEFLGLDGDPKLLGMVRAANRGECSAEDIRNIRYRLLEAATAFYERERDAHMQMADLFSKYIVVAGALQTSGDYALEYVMNTYWPGYGRVTAKFINPFKNILFTYLGEQINIMAAITAEYSDGSIPAQQIDFVEVVLKSTEEAMASAIGFLIVPDDVTGAVEMMRKAKAMEDFQNATGYIVAAYLLTSYVEHYYGYNGKGKKGEKGDVYRSILAAFADLGYESLKAWVLDYVQKYGKKLFEMIGKCCGEVFKKVFKTQINAAALKAGQKAYGDSIKGKITEFAPGYSELSRDVFKNAIKMRDAASAGVHAQVDSAFKSFSTWLASDGYDMQEFVLGRTINYFLGGTGEDGTGSIGGDTRDVLYESLTKWLGVKVGDVYEGGGLLNPYDVTYRIEDGKIKIGIFGYIAEISILENIMVFGELLFEGLFAWMDTLWEAGKTVIDTENVPDPRVRIIKSTVEISNQLERQLHRAGTLEWKIFEYRKKTEKGDETII